MKHSSPASSPGTDPSNPTKTDSPNDYRKKLAVIIGNRILAGLNMRHAKKKDLAKALNRPNSKVTRMIDGTYPPDAVDLKLISDFIGQPLDYFYKE